MSSDPYDSLLYRIWHGVIKLNQMGDVLIPPLFRTVSGGGSLHYVSSDDSIGGKLSSHFEHKPILSAAEPFQVQF